MSGLYLKVGLSHVSRISKNFAPSFMIVAIVAPWHQEMYKAYYSWLSKS